MKSAINMKNRNSHIILALQIFLVLMFTIAIPAQAKNPWKLRPFTTDGCTLISNGTRREPNKWHHCCYQHDLAYWAGGTYTERRNADLALLSCMRAAGEPLLGFLAYLGVRVGGTALFPDPYRWAYGWTGVRGYWALTPEELAEVRRLSPTNSASMSIPQPLASSEQGPHNANTKTSHP
jgi:hypothetical protein